MKLHAGKAKLRPELERTALEAREAMATKLYGREAIRAAMSAAAGKGLRYCVLKPAGFLDLKDTAAAKAAVEWLKEEGFTVTWDARRTLEISTHDEAASDLVVSWATGHCDNRDLPR